MPSFPVQKIICPVTKKAIFLEALEGVDKMTHASKVESADIDDSTVLIIALYL